MDPDLRHAYPDAVAFRFGDNRALCDALIALVRVGRKTATCGAARDFGPGGEAPPVVGRRDIVTDWDGVPVLVIRTVEVTRARFCDVTWDFAGAEGENESLEGWQASHRVYFERNGGWTPEMELICERFEVIDDFAADRAAAQEGDAR